MQENEILSIDDFNALLTEPDVDTSVEEQLEEKTEESKILSFDEFNALLQSAPEEQIQQDTVQQQQQIDFPLKQTVAESTQTQISPTHPISDDILDMDSSIAFSNPEELLHSEIAKTVENSMTSPQQKEAVPYKDAIEMVQRQLDGLREQGTLEVERSPLWNVSGQNTAKMAELLISNPANIQGARQQFGITIPEYYTEPLLSETGFTGRAGNAFIEGMTMGYTIQRPMKEPLGREEALADVIGGFAGLYSPFSVQLKAGQAIVMGTTRQLKKIKPIAKKIDDVVLKNKKLASFGEGAIANTVGFNLHAQLGADMADKSVIERIKTIPTSAFHATLFSGVGSLQQFGKISALTGASSVTLLGFAMGPYLTLDENATSQEKSNAFAQSVANGLLLGTMHIKGTASQKIEGMKEYIRSVMPETSLAGQRKMIVESINSVLKNKDIEAIGADIRKGIIEANKISRIKDVSFKNGEQLKLNLIETKKAINNEIAKENIKKYKKEVVPKEDPTVIETKPTPKKKKQKPRFGRDESTRKIKAMLEGLEEPSAKYRYDKSVSQLIGDKQSYRYDSLVQLTKDLGIYNPKNKAREDIVDSLIEYYKKPVLESKKPPKKIDGLKISYDNTGKMKLDIFSTKEIRQIAEKIGINTKKLNRQKMLDAIIRADSKGKAPKDPIPAKKESELNDIMENVAHYEAEILGLSKKGLDFSNLEVQQKKASLRKAKEIEKEIRSKYDPNKSESVNVDIFPGISMIRDILRARKQSKNARKPLTDKELDAIHSLIKGKELTDDGVKLALDALAEKPMSKTIKENGLVGVVNEVRKIFNPLSDMPPELQNKFLDYRYKFMGEQWRISNKVEEWVSKFKNFSEEELKLSYRVLTGEAKMSEITNPELLKQTKLVRRVFDKFGQELVNRDLLSQEAYDGKKGNYLTRVYLRYILDKGPGLGSDISLSKQYQKQRKQLTKEERDLLGEITTPEIPTSVGMYRMLGDIAKYDYLSKIASNKDMVFQPSRVEIDGKKYSIGQAVSEKEALQATYFKADKSQRAIIEKRIEVLDNAIQKAEGAMQEPIAGFEMMPTDGRYGPLSGAYVKKSIANDLQATLGNFESTAIKTFISYWKAGKVAMNPATVMRNFLSNPIQLNMSGMSYSDIARLMATAPLKIKNGDIDYITAGKNGVFGGTWAKEEINALLKSSQKFEAEFKNSGNIWNALSQFVEGGVKKAGGFYSKIDEYYKFVKYLHGKEKGLSDSQATREAQKWVMDYSLVSPAVKKVRESTLIAPFITYQAKIAPLVVDAMNPKTASNPISLIAPYLLAEAVTRYSFDKFDMNEQEVSQVKFQLGQQMVDSNALLVVPFKDEKGRVQAVNFEYGLPHEGILNMTKNLIDTDASGLLRSMGLSPVAMFLSALFTGVVPTQDGGHIEIWNSTMPYQEQLKNYMQFVYDTTVPSIVSSRGPIMNLIENPDVTQVEETLSQELSRFSAYTLKPADPKNAQKANRTFQAKMRQISLNFDKKFKKSLKISRLTAEAYIDTEEYYDLQQEKRNQIFNLYKDIYGVLKYETSDGSFKSISELMDTSIDSIRNLSYNKSMLESASTP